MDSGGTAVRRSSRLASQTPRSPRQHSRSHNDYSPSRRVVNFIRESSPGGRLPIRMIPDDNDDVFNDAIEGQINRQRLFPHSDRFTRLRESLSSHVSPHLSRVINRLPATGYNTNLGGSMGTAKPARRVVRRPELEGTTQSPSWILRIPIILLRMVVWLMVNGVVLIWLLLTLPMRIVNFCINYGGWLRRLFWAMLFSFTLVAFSIWWNRQGKADAMLGELKQTNHQLRHEYDTLNRQVYYLISDLNDLKSQQQGLHRAIQQLPQPIGFDDQGKIKVDQRLAAHFQSQIVTELQRMEKQIRSEMAQQLKEVDSQQRLILSEIRKKETSEGNEERKKRVAAKWMEIAEKLKEERHVVQPKQRDERMEERHVEQSKGDMHILQPKQSDISASSIVPKSTESLIERIIFKAPFTSSTYQPPFRWDLGYLLRWLGVKGPVLVHPPSVILHSQLQLGECWPMEGDHGMITMKLSRPTMPTAFSLEHSPLSPDYSSAPKEIEIYGMRRLDSEPRLLAKIQYDPTNSGRIPLTGRDPIEYVQLRILSNWGRSEYTCVYRFNVFE